jgi:hypothetical protein
VTTELHNTNTAKDSFKREIQQFDGRLLEILGPSNVAQRKL